MRDDEPVTSGTNPFRIAFMVCFIAGLAFALAHCTAQRTLDGFPRSTPSPDFGTVELQGDAA